MLKFSILIPNYGLNSYLDECLKSVLKQIDNNLYRTEVLFCDQSDDKDFQLIKQVVSSIDIGGHIRIIRLPRPSILEARKQLIYNATGDYIVFLDSDDYISDSYLKNIDKFLKDNNFPDLVINNLCMVDSNKNKLDHQLPIPSDIDTNLLDYFYYSNYLNSIVRKIFKRNMFYENEVPDVDVKNGDDWLISFPIMRHSKTIYFTKDSFGYFYRQNQNSSTHSFDYDTAISSLYFKDEIISLNMSQFQKKLYLKQKIYDYTNCFRSLLRNKKISFQVFIKGSKEFRKNLSHLKLLKSEDFLSKKHRFIFFLLKIRFYLILFFIFRF